ncbi:hypothetical protein [Spiroplasma endosymbiont of Nebria brevicollis]|uniref:hypothetical protein n=1 Tax=Spiroplasma endosymbiont of Nebria brevicollis TaxID=3066284 RepID=UPI00313DF623
MQKNYPSNITNKEFKQWHLEQRLLMNQQTLKLHKENLIHIYKTIYDNLQIQKELIQKYLLLDITSE